jgi:uracil-DNA glycosylase
MHGGTFPFGRPSTERPPRRPTEPCSAFVLGVYPSALHVRWRLPAWYANDGEAVAAMAVDVEPSVFWDGCSPDPGGLIETWKQTVGFVEGDDPGSDGHATGVRLNGSSGLSVRDRVLTPLGINPLSTWFTDASPWFYVKYGTSGRREQGNVVSDVYNPFARARGREAGSLPPRPSPAELVRRCSREERARLRDEILASDAPIVLTLGEEARRVLLSIADSATGCPTSPLSLDSYGNEGRLTIEHRPIRWLALVHPGQRSRRWVDAHDQWVSTAPLA